MFGFSDNDVQAGGDAADPATAVVGAGGSLDNHDQLVPAVPTSAPMVSNAAGSGSDYIMTDVQQPVGSPAGASDSSSIPVIQHPAPVADLDAPDTSVSGPSDDLLSLKQSALQELSPLVGHLDQTPEEKFRTTMMLIQASDDQALLRDAFQAAKEITDEKARAQALLDVVNEINYFTQQAESE